MQISNYSETESQLSYGFFQCIYGRIKIYKDLQMFDIGNQKIDVKCGCGRIYKPTLKDVANQKKISCSCGNAIQLQDNGGSAKKTIGNVNKSLGNFEKALKKLGR